MSWIQGQTSVAIPIRVKAGPPKVCADYMTQGECEAADCYWYNGACHSTPRDDVCSEYTNEQECKAAGCFWYDNACHKEPSNGVAFDWKWILLIGGAILLLGGDK